MGRALNFLYKRRKSTQPLDTKNCGSVFKNDPSTKKFFELQLENAEVIKKIFGVVGEENLFKIIFLRNKYCHPYLTDYFIKTYLNGEHEKIEFNRKKYDKLISVNIDELELTNDLVPKLRQIETELKKMSNNYNEMRFL